MKYDSIVQKNAEHIKKLIIQICTFILHTFMTQTSLESPHCHRAKFWVPKRILSIKL